MKSHHFVKKKKEEQGGILPHHWSSHQLSNFAINSLLIFSGNSSHDIEFAFISFQVNPTRHAIILAILYSRSGRAGGGKEPCCVPIKLRKITVFARREGHIKIQTFQDMIVEECGCRWWSALGVEIESFHIVADKVRLRHELPNLFLPAQSTLLSVYHCLLSSTTVVQRRLCLLSSTEHKEKLRSSAKDRSWWLMFVLTN